MTQRAPLQDTSAELPGLTPPGSRGQAGRCNEIIPRDCKTAQSTDNTLLESYMFVDADSLLLLSMTSSESVNVNVDRAIPKMILTESTTLVLARSERSN